MALATAASEESAAPSSSSNDTAVVVAKRYQILTDQPLPQYDSPASPAFSVIDLQGLSGALYALVGRIDHCPRIDTIPNLLRLQKLAMVKPIDVGVVYWPPANARLPVLIFEQPWGNRFAESNDEAFDRWREDWVVDRLLTPVAPVLAELHGRFITHRAIRLNNIFFNGSSNGELMLGESVSSQPGFYQPSIMEPIESAMAQPSGRGDGTPADDIYSLGVLIVILLSGGNPVANLSDSELIEAKISKGSYAVLTHKIRASLNIVEVLRGMLCDDPHERWTVEELEQWLAGRHLSPKQPMLPRKAQRAFHFEGKNYLTAPTLSFALSQNWAAALPLARDGAIERWVRRSLGDEEMADEILAAMETAKTDSVETTFDDILLSLVLVVLDPMAPIRYKGFSASAEGLHKAYAIDYADPTRRQLYLEVIHARIATFWTQMQPTNRPDHMYIRRSLDSARRLLQRARGAFGAERVLYTVNPGWACQSPYLARDYVSDITEILPALDRLSGQSDTGEIDIDPHIIAFCGVNHRRMQESIIFSLANRGTDSDYTLNLLQMLGEIQKLYGPKVLHSLPNWCINLVGPVIETYQNRATRDEILKASKKAASKGSLSDLMVAVDDIKQRNKDERGFQHARYRFATYSQQVHWIKVGGLRDPNFVRRVSRPVACVITSALAGLSVLTMTVIYVL